MSFSHRVIENASFDVDGVSIPKKAATVHQVGLEVPQPTVTKVRQVVEYALTQIPAEKLLMGIPNYGYNWTLPYEKGVTKAETIGNVGAVRLAGEYGAPIQYDQEAQSPYFIYRNQGREQEVWFEDVRSIAAKIELAKEYELYGVGYWNLMRPFRANWIMLE